MKTQKRWMKWVLKEASEMAKDDQRQRLRRPELGALPLVANAPQTGAFVR